MIPVAKKFQHAEISSEDVEIISDDEVPPKIGLSALSESSHTAPAPKRLRKGKKKDTCTEQVMLSYVAKSVEASRTIMQSVATPAIPPCVYLLAEAIQELEKHPEIFEDEELYDFATACFLTITNRVIFLSLPTDRRVAWLKNRYMSSLH
ncbi:hypothetical protein KSP39_PZI022607 [Platanthera zijinensis]|uniref:Uncharacterized protein n=1 Tax=Platanthera zijinensis TaxID=2320716 RepID=A0AAP0AW55_9ASPA